MLSEATRDPQVLVNVELTPNWVEEWNLDGHLQQCLAGIDRQQVVKMQILKYLPAQRQYCIRFYDVNLLHEDAFVEVDAFIHMLHSHLHGNAVEQAAHFFQMRTIESSTRKFEIVESLAIVCVLLVFVMMYLIRR